MEIKFNPVLVEEIPKPKNMNRPAQIIDAFLEAGLEAAEVCCWQDRYSSFKALYSSLHNHITTSRRNEVKIIRSGGKVFLVRLKKEG